MALQPGTNRQVPDHSIMDHFNKQAYLGNYYDYSLGNNEILTTSEYPLILLTNNQPSTQAFPYNWLSLFCDLRNAISVTATQSVILRAYLNPTITSAGTSKTPTNLRSGSSNASVAALSINPTISANGTLVDVIGANAFETAQSQKMLIIDPNHSLLITVQTSSNTTFIGTNIGWYEL